MARGWRSGVPARARLQAVAALASVVVALQLVAGLPAETARGATPTLRGPVIVGEWPDPEVVLDPVGGRYWAFATNFPLFGEQINVPVRSSPDLSDWSSFHFDALPTLPSWATSGWTWAPGVARIGERWAMYFTAHHAATGRQCVGVATSDEVAGPYSPRGEAPLVCQLERGGSIDASPFQDPATGTWWLHWKSDENAPGVPDPQPRLWAQQLTSDGLALVGSSTPLLGVAHEREAPLVEAPEMVATPAGYVLLYSANHWESSSYFVHWAMCSGPAGPCSRVVSPGEPWLDSSSGIPGPGGASVVRSADGRTFLAFHGWIHAVGYAAGGNRAMFLEPITFDGVGGGPRLRPDLPRHARSPGLQVTSNPTAVVLDDAVHHLHRGSDGGLWHADAAATVRPVGGLLRGGPDTTRSTDGTAFVTIRGVDDAIWLTRGDGTTWGSWTGLGGLTRHPPSVAANGSRLDVYATGVDHQLWRRSSLDLGTTWGAWTPLGGHLTSGPDAVAWGAATAVVVRGVDSAAWLGFDGPTWSGWFALGGILRGGPAVAAATDRLIVAGRGRDDAVWVQRWTVRPLGWTGVGGQTRDEPDLVGHGGGALLVIRGIDDRTWTNLLAPSGANGGWQPVVLAAAPP